jgi:hypothetical protein
MGDARPKPEQDGKGRFVSGNIGGGRPKGARAKLGEDFLKALQDSFAKNGAETIETVRLEKPDQYLKVVASILPKELELSEETMQAMVQVVFRAPDKRS